MYLDDAGDTAGIRARFPDLDKLLGGARKMPAPSSAHNPEPDADNANLIVIEDFDDDTLASLAEPSPAYAAWLRVVMLRALTRTPALGRLKGNGHYNLARTCEFLGFTNFEPFLAQRSLSEVRLQLEALLQRWEAELETTCRLPTALQHNIDALGEILDLSAAERELLGLAVLIHAEAALGCCCELLGSDLSGHHIERILAPMLGHKTDVVAACLQRNGKLASSGLLTIDLNDRFGLCQMLDLLTMTFASRMMVAQADIRQIIQGFVRMVSPSTLSSQDYAYAATDLKLCLALLRGALAGRACGVNILIHGKPGSGKTEFARLLATELQLPLLEISACNLAGAPVVPIRRVRNYRIAQAFFKHKPALVLFDECEEILNQVSLADGGDNEANIPRKSWINKVLESNEVPTIWIANSISGFDDAYLRRFHVCFEMPTPTRAQREKMAAQALGDTVSPQALRSIANHDPVTPALLAQTATVLKLAGQGDPVANRDELALHLINHAMRTQGKPNLGTGVGLGVAGQGFVPQWVNGTVELEALRDTLRCSRSARLCIYGPPGTGKTAFGQWLADQLAMPHHVVKASDLLGPYVGETEQNIARAFELAAQHNALLQFDEVDSFLQDRRKATRQWELTQVNEMLTQMETYTGVFIASTNLFKHLDEASLRRFDMAIKFDFMRPESACAAFAVTCQRLGVSDTLSLPHQQQLAALPLTPGDFEQVMRRARLLRLTNALAVLEALQAAVALKQSAPGRSMGFLAAA